MFQTQTMGQTSADGSGARYTYQRSRGPSSRRGLVDMFVVATATFRILYAVIILDHNRRRVIHFDVTRNPTQAWLAQQITEAFPWDTVPRYLLRDRDTSYFAQENAARAP